MPTVRLPNIQRDGKHVNRQLDVCANADGEFTVRYMEKQGAVYRELAKCTQETYEEALTWGRDCGMSEQCDL